MNEEKVRQIIREELSRFIFTDRYVIDKNIQSGNLRSQLRNRCRKSIEWGKNLKGAKHNVSKNHMGKNKGTGTVDRRRHTPGTLADLS